MTYAPYTAHDLVRVMEQEMAEAHIEAARRRREPARRPNDGDTSRTERRSFMALLLNLLSRA